MALALLSFRRKRKVDTKVLADLLRMYAGCNAVVTMSTSDGTVLSSPLPRMVYDTDLTGDFLIGSLEEHVNNFVVISSNPTTNPWQVTRNKTARNEITLDYEDGSVVKFVFDCD